MHRNYNKTNQLHQKLYLQNQKSGKLERHLYNHELGNDNDGNPMTNVFIESSDFDIDPGGEDFQFISRIIPDIKFTGTGSTGSGGQSVNVVLKRRNFPGESLTTAVTSVCNSATTKIDTPVSIGEISSETFNRLVRVLELSLNRVDIDATLSVNETQRNENKFNKGDIIWNLSTNQLQLWTGEQWVDLYSGNEKGVQAVAQIGNLTVATGGDTSIEIGLN